MFFSHPLLITLVYVGLDQPQLQSRMAFHSQEENVLRFARAQDCEDLRLIFQLVDDLSGPYAALYMLETINIH